MEIKHICIITSGFPTPNSPTRYTFVDQLACAFADAGYKITVIAPVARFKKVFDKSAFYKKYWTRKTENGNIIDVYSPLFFSYSSKRIGFINTGIWTTYNFLQCVRNELKKMEIRPDILYAHFLVPSGYTAARLGEKFNIPSFCAFGESGLWSVNSIGIKNAREGLKSISGIISVSTENKRILVENKLCDASKIEVFPNGVNHSLFYPRNKKEMRDKYGFPHDCIIGVYTGAFNESKGVMRVQKAAEGVKNLKMIYIGSGDLEPIGSNILYKGKTPHSQIPELLSAADFFVLPTLAEGCCNAIIEAMACGLPIISSDRAFNDDILNDSYAIRVNPESIEDIKKAMELLCSEPIKRETMGNRALSVSKKFDVFKRANSIINWASNKY